MKILILVLVLKYSLNIWPDWYVGCGLMQTGSSIRIFALNSKNGSGDYAAGFSCCGVIFLPLCCWLLSIVHRSTFLVPAIMLYAGFPQGVRRLETDVAVVVLDVPHFTEQAIRRRNPRCALTQQQDHGILDQYEVLVIVIFRRSVVGSETSPSGDYCCACQVAVAENVKAVSPISSLREKRQLKTPTTSRR